MTSGFQPYWTPQLIRIAVEEQALRFFVETKRIPGSRDWEKFKLKPSKPTIRKHLGIGLNALMIELAFTAKEANKRYTREELIDFLYLYKDLLSRQPTSDDFRSNRPKGFPSILAYYKHFKSFQEACLLAGFDTNRGYKKEFLIERIRDFIKEFARTPYEHELDGRARPPGYPKGSTYDKHFGSVKNCLHLMGYTFTPNTISRWTAELIKTTVDKEIRFFMQKHGGRIPTRSDWDNSLLVPSRGIIRKILGLEYNALLELLGYTPIYKSPKRYSSDELLMYLHLFIEDEFEPPTANGFRRFPGKYPNPINYQRRFGSWDNALLLAGFDLNNGYFGIRQQAQDGDICASIGELTVDNFLSKHSIPHQRNRLYAHHPALNPNGLKSCDFVLATFTGQLIYVEFAGMKNKNYLKNLNEKQILSNEMNVKLIIIYPTDLNRLDEIFASWLIPSQYV